MILVFTGNGKGKTTAAFGQALRSLGNGKKVKIVQFIKGPWKSGEDILISKIKNQKSKLRIKNQKFIEELENFYDLEIVKGGIGFVEILDDKHPRSDHKKAAKKTWELCKEAVHSKKYDLVIMDEINIALDLKLIDGKEVKRFLKSMPQDVDLILTGRGAPDWLVDMADLVTEMKDVKHPYHHGEKAKQGIEF